LGLRLAFGLESLETSTGVPVELVREAFGRVRKAELFSDGFHPLLNTDQYKSAVLYGICRYLAPRTVVEVGVASGTSSAGILKEIEERGYGHLYSIDLPDVVYQTDDGGEWTDPLAGKPQGWRVTDSQKPFWTLKTGPSRDLLPLVLNQVRTVDVFYHDGEHTHEAMSRELQLAWTSLRNGGIMAVDNINWNSAFEEFVSTHGLASCTLFPYVGIVRKPLSSWRPDRPDSAGD
jgi:hypothetical protein